MSEPTGPPRLLDANDSPDLLRDAVRAAVEDRPPDDVAAELDRCLDELFGGGPPGGPPAGPNGQQLPTSGIGALASKILIPLAVAVVVVGAALIVTDRPSEHSTSAETVRHPGHAERGPASSPIAARPAPAKLLRPRDTGQEHETVVEQPAPPTAGQRRPPSSDKTTSAPVQLSRRRPATKEPAATAALAGSARATVSVEADLGLVLAAQDALRAGKLQEALDLAQRHAAGFPESVLAEEREVIAVTVLSKLGRRDEARARQSAFVARFPDSPHRKRLERMTHASEAEEQELDR